jgi:hypothetical protein
MAPPGPHSFSSFSAVKLFSLPHQLGSKYSILQYSRKSSTHRFPSSLIGILTIFHPLRSSQPTDISIPRQASSLSYTGFRLCGTRHSRCMMTRYRCPPYLPSAVLLTTPLTALFDSRLGISSRPLCFYGVTVTL